MNLEPTDIIVFVAFIGFVVAFSMFKGRREKGSEDYFLAGRGLVWPLIGFSLIAANISTEQFVGMNGSAAGGIGLAIASYDWVAAVTLVFVALFFLPRLLRSGIYTMPEFLEYRYNMAARTIMSIFMMVIYVGVTISAVLYSGGLTIHTIFGLDLTLSVWLIGIVAAIYTAYGGLKSVAWADLFQGSALIIGGFMVLYAGLKAVGGFDVLYEANQDSFHVGLSASHGELPWTALLAGIWIPNLYYWGFNQYIAQRTLAAKDLKHGQLGVLMAAGIQIVLPLIIVIPGIIAAHLYAGKLSGTSDAAFPLLIRELIPVGLRGFIFAAIAGAVISSLASMLNSASTIFTMDLYTRHFNRDAKPQAQVTVGRIMTIVFVVIGCLIAPMLGDPRFKGIFHFIQDFQGYASPGILACFLFGFFVKRTPPAAAVIGLLLNIPVYAFLHLERFSHICFLNKMAITFGIIALVMALFAWLKPVKKPKTLPVMEGFDTTPAPSVKIIGIAIVVIVAALYVIFW